MEIAEQLTSTTFENFSWDAILPWAFPDDISLIDFESSSLVGVSSSSDKMGGLSMLSRTDGETEFVPP